MTPLGNLQPCAGEAELADPAVTGEFAREMASVANAEHVAPWCGYILRRDGVPAGFAGFKAPPDASGTVELGYLTFPAHTGQGVASEIAASLTEIAFAQGAMSVVAHTLPQPNASTRVLEKAGFERAGTGLDDDAGEVWRWERVRTA